MSASAAAPPTRARFFITTAIWAGFVVAAIWLLGRHAIVVGAGNWIDRQFNGPHLWSRFVAYLGGLGVSPLAVGAISAAAVAALILSGWAMWLALNLRDAERWTPDHDA